MSTKCKRHTKGLHLTACKGRHDPGQALTHTLVRGAKAAGRRTREADGDATVSAHTQVNLCSSLLNGTPAHSTFCWNTRAHTHTNARASLHMQATPALLSCPDKQMPPARTCLGRRNTRRTQMQKESRGTHFPTPQDRLSRHVAAAAVAAPGVPLGSSASSSSY